MLEIPRLDHEAPRLRHFDYEIPRQFKCGPPGAEREYALVSFIVHDMTSLTGHFSAVALHSDEAFYHLNGTHVNKLQGDAVHRLLLNAVLVMYIDDIKIRALKGHAAGTAL